MKRTLYVIMIVGAIILSLSGKMYGLYASRASSGVKTLQIIDDFSKGNENLWEIKFASLMQVETFFGYRLQDSTKRVWKIDLKIKKNEKSKKNETRWFTLTRAIQSDSAWEEAKGIRLVFAVGKEGSWWMALHLSTKDGTSYSQVILPYQYSSRTWYERLLPFAGFKSKKSDGKKINPRNIRSLQIVGSGVNNTLFLDEISLYKKKATGLVRLSTSHPANNIFTTKEAVVLKAEVAADVSRSGDSVLDISVKNFWGRELLREKVAVSGSRTKWERRFRAHQPGWFEMEVRLRRNGKIVEVNKLPFAVLTPLAAYFHKADFKAFFGMDGSGGGDALKLLGATWHEYRFMWNKVEPEPGKVLISLSAVKKAVEKSREQGRRYWFILWGTPRWASSAPPGDKYYYLYPPKDWEAFRRYVRLVVDYQKEVYPDGPRVYELWPEPIYPWDWRGTMKQLAGLDREAAITIHKNDPKSIVLGYVDMGHQSGRGNKWMEDLFSYGVYQYLDGVSTHPYSYPAPPEEGKPLLERIADLRAVIRRYGPEKPIWMTEQGWVSNEQSTPNLTEQAQWVVRQLVLAKSAGVRIYNFFYLSDYSLKDNPGTQDYGITFNLDPKRRFGPAKVAPKPAYVSYAVLIRQIENAEFVRRLKGLGETVRGLIFKKKEAPILVLWDYKNKKMLSLPTQSDVRVVDMMGAVSEVKSKGGKITLSISPSPIYVYGLETSLYLGPEKVIGLRGPLPVIFPAGWAKNENSPKYVALKVSPLEVDLSSVRSQKVELKVTNLYNAWLGIEIQFIPSSPAIIVEPDKISFRLGNYLTVTRNVTLTRKEGKSKKEMGRVEVRIWSRGILLAKEKIEVRL